MDIIFFKNFSVDNKLSKNITEVARFSAVRLPEGTDDNDVAIRFTCPTSSIRWSEVNYFSFDGAYYFLDSVEKERNSISIVHGHMDLLMTFKGSILGLRVLADRSTSAGSPRLEDTERNISVDSTRTVVRFPHQLDLGESAGFYGLLTSQKGYTAP